MAIIKKSPPSSGFADSTYYGLDAFRFVNAAGVSVAVRWSLVPLQPVSANPTHASTDDQNYLFDALIGQIKAHPLQWRLMVTIGKAGDPTNDATLPWPNDRPQIDAGTVTFDHVSSETAGRCTDVNYDPLVLPSGIEPSDDPLLSARSAVYARSFTLRAGEHAAALADGRDAPRHALGGHGQPITTLCIDVHHALGRLGHALGGALSDRPLGVLGIAADTAARSGAVCVATSPAH
jgi:catalase